MYTIPQYKGFFHQRVYTFHVQGKGRAKTKHFLASLVPSNCFVQPKENCDPALNLELRNLPSVSQLRADCASSMYQVLCEAQRTQLWRQMRPLLSLRKQTINKSLRLARGQSLGWRETREACFWWNGLRQPRTGHLTYLSLSYLICLKGIFRSIGHDKISQSTYWTIIALWMIITLIIVLTA